MVKECTMESESESYNGRQTGRVLMHCAKKGGDYWVIAGA